MQPIFSQIESPGLCVWSEVLFCATREPLQFLDVTEAIAACAARAGIHHCLAGAQL